MAKSGLLEEGKKSKCEHADDHDYADDLPHKFHPFSVMIE